MTRLGNPTGPKPRFSRADVVEAALEEYDARVEEYYDLRDANRRVDAWTTQIVRALGQGPAAQSPVLEVLHEQRLALH